jgi:protein AaeX
MIGEVSIYGVFVSPLLLFVAAALPLTALLRRLLAARGAYRFVWHRALFDFSLFDIVLGVVSFAAEHVLSP